MFRITTAFIFSLTILSTSGWAFTTKAKQAILMDAQTQAILFEKNAEESMVPSSMTKIMTLYMLFERLSQGKLSSDDTFYVSERAWRKGGSKMFVELGSQVAIKNLIPGILVQSGNDACIVVSEGLAGTEPAFVASMNETAHELGATGVNFVNSNGWPDDEHTCTAKDLAIIALKTIQNFPQLYAQYYAQAEFTFNKIKQRNLNPLLYAGIGGDGLKTGHTEAGGYGLVGSAKDHNGRRLIMVINGLRSKKARREESIKLIQYGMRAFQTLPLYKKGEIVGTGETWLAADPEIKLAASKDVFVTFESHEREKLKIQMVQEGPIKAPIKAGDSVAKMVITGSTVRGQEQVEIPLVAAEDMDSTGVFGRVKAAAMYLLLGHNPRSKKDVTRGDR